MNKKTLINRIETMGTETSENYPHEQMVDREVVLNLIDQLEEPENTEAQAWETLAPRFSMSATELQRQVLDGFLAMTAEEIEMESDKIKKLAKGIKKLHAENEELKAKLDEPEKVVVPQFVADFIKWKNKENLDKWKMASSFISYIKYKKGNAYEWSQEEGNMDKFLSALVNDYEVEKEPLYYVELPGIVWSNEASELEDRNFYLKLNVSSGEIIITPTNTKIGDWCSALTEKEIKDYDPRYWAFAVEVEE